MMTIIIVILLFVIAYAVAPEAMNIIFTLIWGLIKIVFVLAIIGGAIALVINL